jgi:flagellin
MLQVADGAMSTVNDILVRMKTLAVQAGSGQLGTTERSMLNTEYTSLLSEIDRVAQATTFNGVALVNGSSTTTSSLNTEGTNDKINAANGVDSIVLGNSVGDAVIKTSYDSTTHVLTLTNLTSGVSQGVDIGSTAIAAGSTQTVNFANVGATITLNSAFAKGTSIAPANSFTVAGTQAGAISSITISSASTGSAAISLAAITGSLDASTTNTAAVITLGAFTGTVDVSTTGTTSVTLSDGTASHGEFKLNLNVTTAVATGGTSSTISIGDLGALVYGQSGTANTTTFSFKLGTGTTSGVDNVDVSVSAVSATALGLNGTEIDGSDATNADAASTAISGAITTLNTARAGVGASQNRLQFAANNLSTSVQNTEAARSNLMDLDMASEMTKFTNAQVLEQAGVSMLAQANQMPQHLLRLFQ